MFCSVPTDNKLISETQLEADSRVEQHFVDWARIEEKFIRCAVSDVIRRSYGQIRAQLAASGIDFENKPLPVSMLPTAVSKNEVGDLALGATTIRRVLGRVIDQFIDEHKRGDSQGPLHRFFSPYGKWFDLIANEYRSLEPIQLMRYDAVRDIHGSWAFMETNTCCPGGVIHCAVIRRAWINSEIGQFVTKGEKIVEHAVDSPEGFVRFLAKIAEKINPAYPNIAIININGNYKNELDSLRRTHARLAKTGEIAQGIMVLGDIGDVRCDGEMAHLNGLPIALIYNKLDQLKIDPKLVQHQGWCAASRCKGTEFLNSCGALFLTEAKRVLALLSDPRLRRCLDLSEDELQAISCFVPYTRLLGNYVG